MAIARAWSNALFWMRSKPVDLPVIFVTGAPRSGTSLLKNLLVSHSRLVGTKRESTGLLRWRDLTQFSVDEFTISQIQTCYRNANSATEFYTAIASLFGVGEKGDGTRFVDKVNVRYWRLRFIAHYFPQALFVNIVRDGRDAYCSARHHPNVLQSGSLKKFAKYWQMCVGSPEKALPQSRLITIRYEDLVTNPSGVLQYIMQFLGLQFEPTQIDVNTFGAVSSLAKRKVHDNLAKPISASSAGRWRKDLAEQDNLEFVKIAAEDLQRFGFDLSARD